MLVCHFSINCWNHWSLTKRLPPPSQQRLQPCTLQVQLQIQPQKLLLLLEALRCPHLQPPITVAAATAAFVVVVVSWSSTSSSSSSLPSSSVLVLGLGVLTTYADGLLCSREKITTSVVRVDAEAGQVIVKMAGQDRPNRLGDVRHTLFVNTMWFLDVDLLDSQQIWSFSLSRTCLPARSKALV